MVYIKPSCYIDFGYFVLWFDLFIAQVNLQNSPAPINQTSIMHQRLLMVFIRNLKLRHPWHTADMNADPGGEWIWL